MGGVGGQALQRADDHRLDPGIVDRARRARARLVAKPVQPMLGEAPAPLADRAFVDLNWFRPHASIGIRCLSADLAYPRITR